MKLAYFQPFSGASGDMVLGALVDAGLALRELEAGLETLRLPGWRLEESRVMRGAFAATRVRVILEGPDGELLEPELLPTHSHEHGQGHSHSHDHDGREPGPDASALSSRGLADILSMIESSSLPPIVQRQASDVFRRLGEVEARAHDQPLESVYFHEVGAVDSIVDIVGACLGLHILGIDEVRSAPVTVGTGFVRGAHGPIPLPSPATIGLLRGFPIVQRDSQAELTTPTGAALLSTLAVDFGTMPPLSVESVGYGAGSDRPDPIPNLLRVIVGTRPSPPPAGDRVLLLETNLDDMSPEWTGHLFEKLFAAGALDVWLTPILMKKGRPAHELRVLCEPEKESTVVRTLFVESTTFGLRRRECDRLILTRELREVETPWGVVRVKLGSLGGDEVSAAPEFEDLKRAAEKAGKPLKEIHRVVMKLFDSQRDG